MAAALHHDSSGAKRGEEYGFVICATDGILNSITRPVQRRKAPMTRVIFVNRYFFPDHSATSQILSDLTFHLAAIGHDVHVITSRQRYDDSRAKLPESESLNGVKVHRVTSTGFGRATLPGRALDYLSFYRSVRRSLREVAQAGDIVVAKTDPPLLSVALASVARQRRAHLVNWLQDIYPETASILGVPLLRGPVALSLATLRNRSLREADATVVVGELMARHIKDLGIVPARVHVIANWCDDETIRPAVGTDNPLREAWHLSGKFVVGHSGNLGRAHDFETVLGAAERLRNDTRIVFLMIGGGKHFEELAKAVKARGLDNSFRFRPSRAHHAAVFTGHCRCALAFSTSGARGLDRPKQILRHRCSWQTDADDRRLRRRNRAPNPATPLRHSHCAGRRSDIRRYTPALVRSAGGYHRNGRAGATNARRTVHPSPSTGSVEPIARGIASAGAIRPMRCTDLFVLCTKMACG